MNKIIQILFLSLLLANCSSDDNTTTVEGQTFELISYIIETPVDFNEDSIFSNNFVEEGVKDCLVTRLVFSESEVNNLFTKSIPVFVTTDDNNNIIQGHACDITDFSSIPMYFQDGNLITITLGGQLQALGELSENILTFNFSNQDVFSIDEILNQNGTIENYEGGAKLIYRRSQ